MGCRLTQNIKHNCEYNPGGIKEVFLLDFRDLLGVRFQDDGLYNSCFVEDILKRVEFKEQIDYVKLDVVTESIFSETNDTGIYQQELQTFIRSLQGSKTSGFLLANANKYLVAYKTYEGKAYSFGIDGGATISFAQQSGQLGDASGYQITIKNISNYPLFEIDPDVLKYHLLSSEALELMITEDQNFVEIYKYKSE